MNAAATGASDRTRWVGLRRIASGPFALVRVRSVLAGLLLALAASCLQPLHALDEVVLNNGRRYLGTILTDSPDAIVLSIDGGVVEFPRSAVLSPRFVGPNGPAADADSEDSGRPTEPPLPDHPLPDVANALQRLREFPWAEEVRQVPVLVTDQGRWQYVPGLSFWAGGFFQLSIHGDPARPAAIEVSLVDPPDTAYEEKQKLLEYILGLEPNLAVDSRFDRVDLERDSFAVGDLWFAVTSPNSLETPGRWTVLLVHEQSLSPARATLSELQSISEPISDATIDPTRPRSWQRASWSEADIALMRKTAGQKAASGGQFLSPGKFAWTALGGERVFVRSYLRDRGRYARSANDWLREVATVGGR